MKRSILVAALAAVVMGTSFVASRAAAQAPASYPASMGSSPLAVIDITKVFKNHQRFMDQMTDLRRDVENVKGEYRKQAEQLNKMAEGLKGYTPGTQDYKRAEEDLFRRRSEMQTNMAMEEKKFVEADARIHYNVYQEILQEVTYLCQQRGIAMVINYNGDKINPEVPEDVLRGIKQNVVYTVKELDITDYILQRISPRAARTPAGPMGVAPLR